jgi:hypothetical protein
VCDAFYNFNDTLLTIKVDILFESIEWGAAGCYDEKNKLQPVLMHTRTQVRRKDVHAFFMFFFSTFESIFIISLISIYIS